LNWWKHKKKMNERYARLKRKYPERVCVIISSDSVTLKKSKFLVPAYFEFGQLMVVIRKHVEPPINECDALFALANNNTLITSTTLMQEISSDVDFTRITLYKESAFG
jgi:hypothetical protein